MSFEDKLITETADKRNELETYLYSMRDKLDGILKPFGTGKSMIHDFYHTFFYRTHFCTFFQASTVFSFFLFFPYFIILAL